jgi:hypothetical protein
MPRHMEHRFRHNRDPIPGMPRPLDPPRRKQRKKHSTNRKRSLLFLPRKEKKRSLAGEKEGRKSLSPDSRIRREGWHHLRSFGPRTERPILMPILETLILGWRPPGVHGNEKAPPKDTSSEGSQSREVSFQVRCPNPRKNPSGIFQDRLPRERSEKKGSSEPLRKDQTPDMSEWPPSGAPSLGPIPGTESPRNRVRNPKHGPVRSGEPLFGSWFAGKPPTVSYETCRCSIGLS